MMNLIEPVFMQYPKTVQKAKQVAENIEIVHQGVERHENLKLQWVKTKRRIKSKVKRVSWGTVQ